MVKMAELTVNPEESPVTATCSVPSVIWSFTVFTANDPVADVSPASIVTENEEGFAV